jgi:hypothetical protein
MAKTSRSVSLCNEPDLYFHTQAADLISDQKQHTTGMRQQFAEDMFKAIHERKLPAYSHRDGSLLPHPIPKNMVLCVRPADINGWLQKGAYEFTWDVRLKDGMSPEPDERPSAPSLTAEQRQAERWQACIDAGLAMPTDTYARYPSGFYRVADSLKITRQSLREDLNKYRERMFSSKRQAQGR